MACLKLLKKESKLKKKQPAVNLNPNPTQRSETVSLVVDKHGISHTGLTEMMSAVVSSGGGNISDLSLSKIQCKGIAIGYESKLLSQYLRKTWKQFNYLNSKRNRYLLHKDGEMLQGLEHVETSTAVIAILLTVTHGKKKILLKIENNIVRQHSY